MKRRVLSYYELISRSEAVSVSDNKELSKRAVTVIQNPDGKNIVLINDILFKSRRSIDWDEIEKLLRKYVGKYYEISETAEKVYIGTDFPDEYTHSKYTKAIQGANEKAKANAVSATDELIRIADNKTVYPDYENKHGNKAKSITNVNPIIRKVACNGELKATTYLW